jgi:hypothetical protein
MIFNCEYYVRVDVRHERSGVKFGRMKVDCT